MFSSADETYSSKQSKRKLGNLIDAMSKVCSEEQFNNILSILIETPILCTDVPKLERKEDSGNKTKGYYANRDR